MQDNNEIIVRLAKLRENIEKKESEMANIRRLGTIKAGVSSDYVHNLRAEHLSCQREYNLILDQNPSLTANTGKITIDTFKDHWLEKKEYQILDPVEVDIEKRLQESDRFRRNAKIGEDTHYEIYFISGSFLRRDKNTSSVVYLGEGGIIATIFKHWVYWYEFGSILSDKYIYRRSIDGQRLEKLDWLSNEKTMEVLGESAHYVSEDSVRKMSSNSQSLVIEVFRETKNETYSITVTDADGVLHINKTFPWAEETENETADNYNNVAATSRATNNKAKNFLLNNPFFILNVSVTDKRHTIISKAEEKAFFSEGNECDEAQARLLNPEKRLYVELDWFFDLTIERTADIHNCISEGADIVSDDLQGITRLNAVLFNFSRMSYEDYFELGYAILELDELYSGIDQDELLYIINASRQKAGIRNASEDEFAQAFGSKRNQMRQLISEKIAGLSEEDHIEFVTMLAEKCIADDEYDDGIIISDVVDQYEVGVQSLIEEATESISGFIEETKNLPNYSITEGRISELIQRVKQWDRLVQPLQLKSMASGTTHESSQDVGREIHDFTVWLHNERDLSSFAITILDAMKPIFAEIGDLVAAFESDKVTLTNIINNNKEAEQLAAEMETLKKLANSVKTYATSTNVNELISKVKAINKRVKRIDLEDDLVVQVRENVCYIARDVAITLHNDKQQTAHALTIAKALVAEFNDIPSLKTKLTQDVETLSQQILLQARIKEQQEAQERAQKAKGIGCLVVIGIIILICLISGGLSQCGSSGSSEPYVFSQSAESGDAVYVDIVSIEPAYSISTQGSYTTTDVACRCKTSDGKTVWVYMSVYEYNKYIDADAKLSNSFNADYETVRYSPAKRISGKARKAESLCDGLSTKTATMILYFDSIK